MEADTMNTKQGAINMTIGSLVGILSLLAYLFIGSRNETLEVQKQLTTKVEQFATVQVKLDSISTVLNQKIVEVRQLGGSLSGLQRIKQQLENDKKKLKYDLSFSLQQYDLKIKDYTSFLAQNELDINKLKSENGSLLTRARTLEQEKQSILTENEGLKYERAALAKTVVDYSLQNADLKEKVTRASAIKAVNVEVAAVATNGKERRVGPYKSSRIDRLKIAFIIPFNPVSQVRSTDIYLRILDPNGAVVGDNSGAGVLSIDGRELGYSTRQPVDLETKDQLVSMLFHRDTDYKPGTYTVELYAEGFRIGEGRFDVK
ncbi:hypothetical protein [Fibrella forsythiae]|uniref:Chromosome segregation protein SMC n=1 Tax=Fibrella forsythiae TaxID=2817061 RepID=A0ABS3JRV5_9BACT|nr:hypothetical protein [Fibrella forsythiae]MBO0952747.1 hypothetical protein [Fibrella forsythiae]